MARRFITRNTATEREEHEAVLAAAINVMELSQNPENLEVHAVLLHQILENVESKLRNFVEEKIIRGQVQPQVVSYGILGVQDKVTLTTRLKEN